MSRFRTLLVVVFAAFFLSLLSAAAQAQATRTWVSGVGDDVNPCSRTAPCKTFAGAISKTATGGEINCLDSAGFGAVTITKSISIVCSGVIGGVLAAGTNGIIVNGAGVEVLLSGLDIDGVGTGLNGVRILNAASVMVRDTSIRNFSQSGIDLQAAANTRLVVQNSQIISNTITGILVDGTGAAANSAVVVGTLFDLNGSSAMQVAGPATVFVSANVFLFSPTNFTITNGASVISFGNNFLRGTGLPTSTEPLR